LFIVKKIGQIDLCKKKHWPNDVRIGYKSPFSMVDFIETNVKLEEELEEFEGAFEKDEIMEL